MKKFNKILLIAFITVSFTSVDIFAQNLGPPPPPGHDTNSNQEGGRAAPIGGGLFILLGLSAAYGGFKGYKFYKKKNKSMLD